MKLSWQKLVMNVAVLSNGLGCLGGPRTEEETGAIEITHISQ